MGYSLEKCDPEFTELGIGSLAASWLDRALGHLDLWIPSLAAPPYKQKVIRVFTLGSLEPGPLMAPRQGN